MLSPAGPRFLFSVQVRIGDEFLTHLGSCDSHEFYRTHEFAVQTVRWLHRGHFYALPDDVLDLPDVIRAFGRDPATAIVEVVRLREVAPDQFDVRAGEVLCQVSDCVIREDSEDPEALEPTVLDPRGQPVSVQAHAR